MNMFIKKIKDSRVGIWAAAAAWAALLAQVAPESAPLLAVFAPIVLGTALLSALVARRSS